MMMKLMLALSLPLVLLLSSCALTSGRGAQFTVQETDFAYSPVTLIVPLNQPVALIFDNTGAVEHDFVIEEIRLANVNLSESGGHDMGGHDMGEMEYDLHISTLPGRSSKVEFTPTEAGIYEFFCTVKGHKEAGMIGKLVVNE